MSSSRSSLFSRILIIVGCLSVVGLSYWFVQTSLAPVPVPPVPPARGKVQFDPKLDVSKNTVFFNLRQMGPEVVEPLAIGRPNPFAPVLPVLPPPVVTTTGTTTSSTL